MANPNPMAPEPITREMNSALVKAALRVCQWPTLNLHDAEAVSQRIADYFEMCDQCGLRPSNLGLYAALGMTRQDVSDVLRGANRSKVSREAIDTIQKAKLSLSMYREQLAVSGKLSPPIAIFWAKNFDGMEDYTRVEVTQPDRFGAANMTPEEVAAQIEQDIPIDTDMTAEVIEV